jgi:membrane protein implicated in regulation of membrane protease activity
VTARSELHKICNTAELSAAVGRGGLSTGIIGAIMSAVVFAIMAPAATSPAPGVLVYGDSAISASLLILAAVAFVCLLIGAIFLRSRDRSAAEERAKTSAPAEETAALPE